MNFFKSLSRFGGLFAALSGALLALAATSTAALAMQVPAGGAPIINTHPTQPGIPEKHPAAVAASGMPGWEIGLIVAGVVIALCVLALLAYRSWSARRRPAGTAREAHHPARVTTAK